jgi:hypothetical protein
MAEYQADVNYNDMDRATLIATIETRDATVAALLEAISKMNRQINAFNKKVFGATSEKLSVILPQEHEKDYVDFEDVTPEAQDDPPRQTPLNPPEQQISEANEKPKRVYTKPHPGRLEIPESIERRPRYIYLKDYDPDKDKKLRWLISERLVMNFEIYVEQTHRQMGVDEDGNVMTAPHPPEDAFYKHKLNLESVALMLMMRFNLHVPCYRLHQLLPKNTIGYNTMIEAMGKAYEELKGLGPVLLSEVKKDAKRLGIDEVPYDSLDDPKKIKEFKEEANTLGWANAGEYPETSPTESTLSNTPADKSPSPSAKTAKIDPLNKQPEKTGKKGKKKEVHTGRLWTIINEEAALVFYYFSLTRSTNIAEWLLGDYKGLVISDAYIAYLNIANNKSMRIILMLCWAHSRRRFTDLVTKDKPTDPVVKEVLKRIGELYRIERRIKGKSDEEILAARLESAQLLELFKNYLEEKRAYIPQRKL